MKIDMEIVDRLFTETNTEAGVDEVRALMEDEEFAKFTAQAFSAATLIAIIRDTDKAFTNVFATFFHLGYKYCKAVSEVEDLNKSFGDANNT